MYKCNICGKEYFNKQQLGGHKSGHNRTTSNIREKRKIVLKCLGCDKDLEWDSKYKPYPKFHNTICRKKYNKRIRESKPYIIRESGNIIELDKTVGEIQEIRQNITECQICGKSVKAIISEDNRLRNLSVDHDHLTNKFRGLLCITCNSNLGWYEKYSSIIEHYLHDDKSFN